MPERLRKQIVPTGVPSLDKLLGGGIPARQSIVVTGDPGTGKTILCSQVAFAQAKQGKRVVLATLASESQEKLLEELEGFSFFDSDLVGDQIYLVSAYSAIQRGPKDAKDLLIKAMRDRKAEVLFIDGLRSIRDLWQNEAKLRDFLYEVNVGVSQLGAIALFTTEYAVAKLMEYPEATTVDGIVSLSAHRVGGRIARRAQVMKLRGRAHLTSEHLMHITSDGIHMVPRIEETTDAKETFVPTDRRAEFGLPELDKIVRGGLPEKSTTLLAGTTGVGKTLLALQFVASGAGRGEPGLLVTYTEPVERLVARAKGISLDVEPLLSSGMLSIDYCAAVNIEADDSIKTILERVRALNARRVVIDGITDLESAILEKERVRPMLSSLLVQLRRMDVTAIFIKEVPKLSGADIDFSDTPILDHGREHALHPSSRAKRSTGASRLGPQDARERLRPLRSPVRDHRRWHPRARSPPHRWGWRRYPRGRPRVSLKVLLAEDEPALREIFCELLRTLGYDCIAASDGSEAVELARKHLPHVVVTDYMMPGRNGVEVIRAVQSDPVLASVPVILMSAGRPPEAERSLAWRFLRKPVEMDVFESTLREAAKGAVATDGFVARPSDYVSPLSLAREEMLGWVSHEFKSPLSAAMTASQLALRSVRSADDPALIERRLTQILRQLHRMDELVNSLLDAAQLQEGKLEIEQERVNLAELLRRVVGFWKDTQPDIGLEMRVEETSAEVEGEIERLRQILDNLISNAIKYGQDASHAQPIVVSLRTDATHAVVSVTDHGRGIAREELPHLFDRFHRIPGQGGRGHGLGLYIAAALARLHGGTLVADSEPGLGSTFSFKMPLAVTNGADADS